MAMIQRTLSEERRLRQLTGLQDLLHSFSGVMNGSLALSALFGSYVFLQFTVLGLCNHAGEGFLPTEQRDLVYYTVICI